MVTRLRKLPQGIQLKVRSKVQGNAYFAHSENLLLSLVFDTDQDTRKFGFNQIIMARYVPKHRDIRQFAIPALNFDAQELKDLIDWDGAVYEPPLLAHLSLTELRAYAQYGDPLDLPWVRDIPCHTQSCERGVQLVTQVSAKVCGEESRDGVIFNILESRRKMPSFKSKKYFNV